MEHKKHKIYICMQMYMYILCFLCSTCLLSFFYFRKAQFSDFHRVVLHVTAHIL